LLEKNDVIVSNNSEEENKEVQAISVADEAPTAHKEIKVYTSQFTTPDQSSDHVHMLDESKRLKHSEAVQKLVEEEVTKNYLPPAITSAVKDYMTRILNLSSSIKKLKHAEVTNIKYKVCEVQNDYLDGNKNKKSDIEE
ncbi:21276_t:CDS:2, partial [Racocetra persica]